MADRPVVGLRGEGDARMLTRLVGGRGSLGGGVPVLTADRECEADDPFDPCPVCGGEPYRSQVARLVVERDAAERERDEAKFLMECADTPLMRDVLAEAVELRQRVKEAEAQEEENSLVMQKGHELLLKAEADRDSFRAEVEAWREDNALLEAKLLRLAQGLRILRDTGDGGFTRNVANRALTEAGVPDPPEEDHL